MFFRGRRKLLPVSLAIFITFISWIIFWNLTTSSLYIFNSRAFDSLCTSFRTCPSCNSIRQYSNVQEYRLPVFETDKELLRNAFHQAIEGPGPGPPRIAFLFLVKGAIPLEPVWRRFLQGHEERWSLYVHSSNQSYQFPPGSLFQGTEIPSKPVQRISISLVDAIRRLLAYALADPRYNNAWFVNVCESSIPIRGFPAVYEYLLGSRHSFVESFLPDAKYHQWETMPEFPILELRKGETWMQMTRKHAIIVISDKVIYAKFAASCSLWCAPDEEYFQTLLHLEDPRGIANRTTMFADWKEPRPIPGSPRTFLPGDVSEGLFREIQAKIQETDGLKQDSSLERSESSMMPICDYNGNPNAECFLFARKFDALSASAILDVINSLPGF